MRHVPKLLTAAALATLPEVVLKDGVTAFLKDADLDGWIAALKDGEISHGERSESIAAIEAAFPDHAQVARVPRDVPIGLNLDWQVAKRSSGL